MPFPKILRFTQGRMTPDRFQQIERVFHAVADAPADARAGLLDRLCEDDAVLRAEVESLLAASSGAGEQIRDAIGREAGRIEGALGWAPSAAPDALAPGAILGGSYRLERLLGEGGMSVVWAATHVVTGAKVALKRMKHILGSPVHHARLLREARAARAVQHPNVCRVLDVVELDDGAPVMVMEHLAGEPLSARLYREGKLPLHDFAALFLPVVSAVGAAHALGIVHRDLKPDNIFLVEGPPPVVKVLDFGIAKLTAFEGAAAATAQLTDSGAVLGTPHYMAPEQALGEKHIDARADVWALGLIAYECLSGLLPTGAPSLGLVFKSIVMEPIPPLARVAPRLPSDVTALVGRMLQRSRGDRLSNLHEVTELFGRYAPQIAAGSARA